MTDFKDSFLTKTTSSVSDGADPKANQNQNFTD